MARRKTTAPSNAPEQPDTDQLDTEQLETDEDCRIDGGVDGSFTLSRRRRAPEERADRDASDLPDEPPPGWCEAS